MSGRAARPAARWTTPSDIAAKVRRRWEDGSLLRALAAGDPFPVLDIPVHGPSAADLGERFDEARDWVASLDAGSRGGRAYDLVSTSVGGRNIGRTELPGRAVVASYDQAWRLLGVLDDVAAFGRVLTIADQVLPDDAVRAWVLEKPLRALALEPEWPAITAAYRWLRDNRGSGRYLRQVDAPGVDTKLVERHRPVLAEMLGVASRAAGFTTDLGLSAKPAMVRLRCAPGLLGLPDVVTDVTLRLDEARQLAPRAITQALIVENEVTYLSVPVPVGGLVLWGKGFDVDQPASLPWLRDTHVTYWGDLDTHGFAILDRLRAWLPQARSVLMDRDTLLAHEERWGQEDRPTAAALTRLTEAEAALYAELVTDRHGTRVRLEQERIDWAWASGQLPARPAGEAPE
ncbi:Wadjet anti-phage system protein JetD domain-containing protein [Promicromonospora aerolata]|uniref:Wadjet anti-phage system protein JetD domain-containing protein n=1 Tax=Promicromonospora aerolata TaxID=195749 RepID=A0ABW4VCV1_9MICO